MSKDYSDSQESDEDSSIDTEERMSEDDDEENGMKEKSDMSATFPSNVYKFQDAFDDTEKDYLAYAS